MITRQYSTFCVALTGLLPLVLAYMPLTVLQAPADQGGVQVLPAPPTGKADPELPQELSDIQREPRPGIYQSAPWTMIIRVPGSNTAPMPTTVPPKGRFPDRSIEPEILLIPREERRFQ
jgi:hypothetical protein